MQAKQAQPDVQHLLALGSFQNWFRMLLEHRGVDRVFLKRAMFITVASGLTAPLRALERALYDRKADRVELSAPPVFILGHWRSGTTNLHYLMSQDPRMGFVTMFQMVAPDLMFVGERWLKPLFAKVTPTKRPIDNLPLSLDIAQEEEFALATLSEHSFYHYWFFPRQLTHYLNTYALFENVPAATSAGWRREYLHLLKKAALSGGNKRLLIKNPTNTGRVREILKLFPDAKFVNIIRDPYRVFLSMRYMAGVNHGASQLQTISPEQIEANVLEIYRAVMQQYLRDRALIPAENLVEVRFEDLEVAPLAEMQRVYEELGLPDYAAAEPGFERYVASLGDFRKNAFELSDDDIAKVNQHWGFAFDAWGYPRRETQAEIDAREAEPLRERAVNA